MPFTRREFLQGVGVAMAATGFAVNGYQHLVPFVHQPEDQIPGVSTWYATTCRECPAGCGMLVRTFRHASQSVRATRLTHQCWNALLTRTSCIERSLRP